MLNAQVGETEVVFTKLPAISCDSITSGTEPSATGESSYSPPQPLTEAEIEAHQKKQVVEFGGKLAKAMAAILRFSPFIGFTQNPFFGAEAIGVDAGATISGSEADIGKIFILAGLNAGELVTMYSCSSWLRIVSTWTCLWRL